jgi:hypothetical protein
MYASFICSSRSGQLRCLLILATVSNAVMDMSSRCFFEKFISFPSDIYPKAGLLVHRVTLFLIFWEPQYYFPRWLYCQQSTPVYLTSDCTPYRLSVGHFYVCTGLLPTSIVLCALFLVELPSWQFFSSIISSNWIFVYRKAFLQVHINLTATILLNNLIVHSDLFSCFLEFSRDITMLSANGLALCSLFQFLSHCLNIPG